MKKIIIITSIGIRHRAFRVFLSNYKGIRVLRTISEKTQKKLSKTKKIKQKLLLNHLKSRDEMEKNFFNKFLKKTNDKSKNLIKNYGYSSKKIFLNMLKKMKPDLIVVYGSSLIKGEILKIYKNKILNVHLGLSPYYKGSATNYFALVNKQPELVGVTFMYLDHTIDGGKIIHQMRPKIFKSDNPHQIGTRLISEMFETCCKLIVNFNKLKSKVNRKIPKNRIYKRKDFTLSSLKKLNYNFKNNMIKKYLMRKKYRDQKFYLIKQNFIKQ